MYTGKTQNSCYFFYRLHIEHLISSGFSTVLQIVQHSECMKQFQAFKNILLSFSFQYMPVREYPLTIARKFFPTIRLLTPTTWDIYLHLILSRSTLTLLKSTMSWDVTNCWSSLYVLLWRPNVMQSPG